MPVEPKPAVPRSVVGSSSTSATSGVDAHVVSIKSIAPTVDAPPVSATGLKGRDGSAAEA